MVENKSENFSLIKFNLFSLPLQIFRPLLVLPSKATLLPWLGWTSSRSSKSTLRRRCHREKLISPRTSRSRTGSTVPNPKHHLSPSLPLMITQTPRICLCWPCRASLLACKACRKSVPALSRSSAGFRSGQWPARSNSLLSLWRESCTASLPCCPGKRSEQPCFRRFPR